MADYPVIIVGGGVAGLGMANALALRGIRSLVLEKTAAPGLIDRGDVMHRSTIRIFEQWKLDKWLMQRQPLRLHQFHILNQDGTALLAMDLSKDLRPPAELVVLRHPDIQSMLEAAAVQQVVAVQRGIICADLIMCNDRVIGVRTNQGEITADLTILATGGNSLLRNNAFPQYTRHDYPAVFVNIRCRKLSEFEHSAYYVLGPQGVMMMVPLPGDEMRIGLQIPTGTTGPQTTADVERALQQRLATFPVARLEMRNRITYAMSKSCCLRFWRKGTAVIGDAAHTTHPAGGQGMNLAFQDAECLAQRLEANDLAPDRIDQACAEYDQIRQREVRLVLARTHFMGTMALVRNSAWILSRAALLRCVNRSRWLKQRLFERIVEVR